MAKQVVSARSWLLLPMEIKAREFESRVLLSCIAAERGYGVLLGRNGFNTDGKYPKGVYFDKCISPNKLDVFKEQTSILGNKLASLDVEGLVYQTKKSWLDIRISQETLSLSSLVCVWGEGQYSMINDVYNASEKLAITGSPSADLWQKNLDFLYQDKVNDIRRRFGDFILMPSNFSTVINANGFDFVEKQFIANGFVRTESEICFLREALAYYQKILDKFVELVPIVANDNPNCTVILRPHPGDDNEFWEKLSKEWPDNVKVVYEGGVSPWILASRLLIHNSCSTGVEAFAREKATIAYTPYTDDRFDQNIPNPLSQQASSVDEVLKLVKANINKKGLGWDNGKTKLYKKHIQVKEDKFACDYIMDAIDTLGLPKKEYVLPRYGAMKKIRIVVRKARRRMRDFAGGNAFSYAYRKQKNPGIKLAEVEDLLKLYQDNLGLWENIEVKKVEEDVFCFYKKSEFF